MQLCFQYFYNLMQNTLSCTLSHTPSHSHSHTHPLIHTLTHTSHAHPHTPSHSHPLTHALSCTPLHTPSHTLPIVADSLSYSRLKDMVSRNPGLLKAALQHIIKLLKTEVSGNQEHGEKEVLLPLLHMFKEFVTMVRITIWLYLELVG